MSSATRYAPSSEGMLAPLRPFMEDVKVSEILVNRPGEVYVESEGRIVRHEAPTLNESHLQTLFQLIARENHQILGDAHPLLSGSLLDGTRVQLVLPPVSKLPALSIRRKVVRALSLDDYSTDFYKATRHAAVDDATLVDLSEQELGLIALYQQKNWPDFIVQAILLKKTIVVSGGTSSGKTTFLNACLQSIPSHERLLILEDTREIEAPHENQLSLLAIHGEQGLAKVAMQTLVQASLRLRPDRIIIGEIRGKEILDFLAAASTGHEGSMTSLHANSPKMAMMRMAQMYKLNNVPSMTDADIYRELNAVIDIVIQLGKGADGRGAQSIYYREGLRFGNEKA